MVELITTMVGSGLTGRKNVHDLLKHQVSPLKKWVKPFEEMGSLGM